MIEYKAGYKYQLHKDYCIPIPFKTPDVFEHDFIFIHCGELWIKKGYAWDGPSGPTWDTPDSMRPSLLHDAGYQLGREGLLGDEFRVLFDNWFRDLCIKNGMWQIRAVTWHRALRMFAGPRFKKQEAVVLTAP